MQPARSADHGGHENVKWACALSHVFSLGGDEVDLIAKKVPGKSAGARMRSVFLLQGVAAYLASGAPRFTQERVKEACLHYNASEC